MQDDKPELGKLLVITVLRNAGKRAARAFVGFGAGAASRDRRALSKINGLLGK
jgi:hypothetical protein